MTVWFRSSPLFMATKASGPCVAPPSTPCCGCCFGALPSCTEGFTSGDPASPSGRRGPCCFLPPVPAAFSGAFSLFPVGLRLLPSPRSFSFVGLLCCSRCRCVFWFVVWSPLRRLVLWVLVCFFVFGGFVLAFLVCCLFVGGLVG